MVAEARGRLSLDGKPFTDAIKQVGQDAESMMKNKMDEIGKSIKQAFTVTAIANYAKGIMDAADQADNLSKRLGVSAETAQSLDVVAKRSGLSISDFEGALLKTTKAATEAQAGNKQLSAAFDTLGISIDDLASLSPEQLFEKVAKAMSDNKGDAEVLAAAYDVIGTKSGPKLQSVLIELGEKGFAKLNEEMLAANQIMSSETVKTWDDFGDKLEDALRATQNFVGNYGTKLIQFLEDTAGAWGAWAGGGSLSIDDFREAQREIDAAAEKAKKNKEEQNRLDEMRNQAAQEEKDLRTEIAKLEEGLVAKAEDKRTAQEKVRDLTKEINDLIEAEKNLSGDGLTNYRDQLKIQTDIKAKRDELAKAEKIANDEQLKALKDQEANLDRIKSLQQTLAKKQMDAAYDAMSNEEKLQFKLTQRAALIDNITRYEEAAGGATEETIRFKMDLLDVDKDIAALQKDDVKKKEEALDITTEQVKAVERLRDLFSGMTEKEVEAFRDSLIKLGNALRGVAAPDLGWLGQLRNIGNIVRGAGFIKDDSKKFGEALAALATAAAVKAPDLSWLKELEGFDLQKLTTGAGFLLMDAKKYGDALAALAAPLAGKPPDLAWLAMLKDFKIPALDKKAADDLSKSIKTIADAFLGLNKIDTEKLGTAVGILSNLNDIKSGSWTVDVKLPTGMEYGIPLVVPDGMNGNLASIAKDLNVLAGLKGVVWA